MIDIDTWFPTTIARASCPFLKKIKKDYIEELERYKIPSNGFCYKPIHKNKKFSKLNKWITEKVNAYAKELNYPNKYVPKESWFVDCRLMNGQPWHAHPGYTFSVIFYLEGKVDDQGTNFRSPYYIDMKNPYNTKPVNDHKANMYNKYTYPSCTYPCTSGELLIFRSYIQHSTDLKTNKNRRIVMVYNYDKNENNSL